MENSSSIIELYLITLFLSSCGSVGDILTNTKKQGGDEFLVAMIMTILVSICSMGLGIFIAIFTSWAKIGYSRILNFIASFYTTVIRGIPELLVIYLIFRTSSGICFC